MVRRLAMILAAISIPLGVSAAFLQPSDFLTASRYNGRPVDVSLELHAHGKACYGALWLSGAMQGTTTQNALGSLHATLDMADGAETGRIKAELRIINGMLYVMIENTNGQFIGVNLSDTFKEINGKWYSSPLTPEMASEVIPSQDDLSISEMKDSFATVANALFSLIRTPTQSGNTYYSLTLRPDAPEALFTAIQELRKRYPESVATGSPEEDAQNMTLVREYLAHTDLHIVAATDSGDTLLNSKLYLAITSDRDVIPMSGTLIANATRQTEAVTVLVPPNTIPLDEESNSSSMSSSSSSTTPSLCGNRTLCGSRPPRSAR